jgi:hypothetical protein
MSIDRFQIYLMALSVIQPARIQDVESYVAENFDTAVVREVMKPNLRDVHNVARDNGLVVAVRQGVYSLSKQGRSYPALTGLRRKLDVRRLFLMKKERKQLKS